MMITKQANRSTRAKRRYAKPRLRAIELVAEEVLAAGCKVGGGGAGPMIACVGRNRCLTGGT